MYVTRLLNYNNKILLQGKLLPNKLSWRGSTGYDFKGTDIMEILSRRRKVCCFLLFIDPFDLAPRALLPVITILSSWDCKCVFISRQPILKEEL